MTAPHDLLFLYMVPGTGHQKTAEAIMEAASHMDPRVQCVGLDAGHQSFPLLGPMVNRVYLQMLKRAPMIWDYLYDNPDVEHATRDARDLLTMMGSQKMKKVLKKHRPAAVICTQAAPAIAMAAEKRKGRLGVPLIGVITDFGVHTYWIHHEMDLYLVGHEDVKQDLIRRGIDSKRVRVTGIPVRPAFGETRDPAQARQKLKLHPNKRTILLMGGGHGLGPIADIVEALKTLPFAVQVIVVCGKNRGVYKKLLKITDDTPDFHIYGYVKDTALLMSAADILITKPGGLTCAEALAKQVPMILTSPIPGQEERNIRFLTKYRVAKTAQSPDEILEIVADWVRHPKKMDSMRQLARLIGKPFAAWEAARLIFDAIHKRGSFSSTGSNR